MDEFEAIADPVRRSLLRRLSRGPARVVDLAADHPISRPAISKHLRVLTEAGLTEAEDRGRERVYRIVRTGLAPVHAFLDELHGSSPPIPDRALNGLDLEVRRTTRERRAGDATLTQEETA